MESEAFDVDLISGEGMLRDWTRSCFTTLFNVPIMLDPHKRWEVGVYHLSFARHVSCMMGRGTESIEFVAHNAQRIRLRIPEYLYCQTPQSFVEWLYRQPEYAVHPFSVYGVPVKDVLSCFVYPSQGRLVFWSKSPYTLWIRLTPFIANLLGCRYRDFRIRPNTQYIFARQAVMDRYTHALVFTTDLWPRDPATRLIIPMPEATLPDEAAILRARNPVLQYDFQRRIAYFPCAVPSHIESIQVTLSSMFTDTPVFIHSSAPVTRVGLRFRPL